MTTPASTSPPSNIGKPVNYKPPKAVAHRAKSRVGAIKDEVWTDVYLDPEWGYYAYTAQLIEWQHTFETSIRLTYYYQPVGSQSWRFGQFSIDDRPKAVLELLEKTRSKPWFGGQQTAAQVPPNKSLERTRAR